MPEMLPISDVHLFPLTVSAGRWKLLSEEDHLLRRFGQLELLDLDASQETDFELRAEADRFLFAINGRARAQLLDLRTSSPSLGERVNISLDTENAQGLLLPFGVACALYAETDSRLIVLSTHSQSHPEDRLATPDELQKYSVVQ
ncbi:MAG: dTDP-4-dehydrorhamnose 3,5-epimerase family protein [Anaerolineales bacterium]